MKIKLTTDSTCDLTAELLKQYRIDGMVPMTIVFGNEERVDGTFNPTEIYDFYESTKTLPKTSAINPYVFEEFFREQTADGSAAVHFSLSSKVSASCENAMAAARQFANVHVVDSRQVSTGTSILLFCAHDIIQKEPNISAKDLAELMGKRAHKVQTSYCIDTITYLYKNGRCNALGLLGANLLDLHPSIHIVDGANTVGRKYRGKMTAVIPQYIEDVRKNNPDYDEARCFITYSVGTDPNIINAALAQTEKLFGFKEIFVTPAGSTITCHCGKGTLGLAFMNK